jgi:hypothetical protein
VQRVGSLRGEEGRREEAEAESGETERETKGHSDLKEGWVVRYFSERFGTSVNGCLIERE